MTFERIKEIVLLTLEKNGIIVELEDGDSDVRSYAIDSITFISFIVDLENEFGITFPDDFLSIEILKSIDGLSNLLLELITGN